MRAAEKIAIIRRLNDELRRFRRGGRVMTTSGIQALGDEVIVRALEAVATFDDFTPDNDPHEEHDGAVMTVDDIRIIWKDRLLRQGSSLRLARSIRPRGNSTRSHRDARRRVLTLAPANAGAFF